MTENTIPDRELFFRMLKALLYCFPAFWMLLRSLKSFCFTVFSENIFYPSGSLCYLFFVPLYWNFTITCQGLGLFSSIMLSTQRILWKWRSTSFISEIFWGLFTDYFFPTFLLLVPSEVKFLHGKCSPGLIWLSHLLLTPVFNLSVSLFYFNEN